MLLIRGCVLSFFLLIKLSIAAQQPKLILPVGHIGGVYEAIFSPDYKHVLTRDRFEVARLWDAKTGYLLANLQGHSDRVYRMGYTRDGDKFFTGSLDGVVIIWDRKKILPIARLTGQNGAVSSGSFNYQGNLFISGSADKKARIWDVNTGKLLLTLDGRQHDMDVTEAEFNRKGDKVRTSSNYLTRNYWDIKTGKLLAKTIYNETLGKFVIKQINIKKDTSFLSDESGEWEFPPIMQNPNRMLVYNINENDVLVTDSSGKKVFAAITGHTDMEGLLYYSPKGDTLYIEPDERMFATAWDSKTMQMKKTIPFAGAPRGNVHKGGDRWKTAIYNNDRSLVLGMANNRFYVWDMKRLIQLPQFQDTRLPQEIRDAFFSADSRLLITLMYNDDLPAWVWDVQSGKVGFKLPFDKEERVTHACFSLDNKLVALFGDDGHISIFDLGKNTLTASIVSSVGDGIPDIIGGQFSPDNKMIFAIDANAVFKVYEIQSKKEIYSLRESGNYVRGAIFTPDNKSILLSTTASLIKKVDLNTKKIQYHFFPLDSTEYFTQVPAGYYQASSGATRLLHYVTKDLKVITFEQLDVKYNRPDKVLEGIGSTDKNLINAYRKAYFKRIKKLGIDTASFRDGYNVPDCDFANRDTIEYEQRKERLTLSIRAYDSAYKLDRFNIWVNDVPVFGQRGINIRRRNTNSFDTTISIRLSQGENRIETSVTNVNGTESYRMPLQVKYIPDIPGKSIAHFIGIGIDQFADSKYNLQYSTKDIRDLSIRLKEKYSTNIIIDTLFNRDVTVENIISLKQKLLQTTVDDKVMIAYSGHGMLSKEYDYYLSTYAVNFDNPEEKGLPYDELENLLDSIPARQKLMLIDACHSGEVDKEDLVTLNASPDSLIKGLKPVAYKKEGNLGLKNSFELMQSLFVNVGKSTGATIISAAAGTQFALERNDLKNGVFTYCILEAMQENPTMNVSGLRKKVAERVGELTKGLQQPTSRNENKAIDWKVW